MTLPRPTSSDEDDLLGKVLTILQAKKVHLVTIDGPMGVGKTTLAARLAQGIGARHVEMDEYHRSGHPPYVSGLDVQRLNSDCLRAIESDGVVVLDGICMTEILDRMDLGVGVSVVVLPDRFAMSGDALDDDVPDEELWRSVQSEDPLKAEVARYLRWRRPHERADILYRGPTTPSG